MQLPVFKDNNQNFQLMQSRWSSILNPVLSLPTSSPVFLKDIAIASGVNVINHKLGATPQGWIVIDSVSNITLYRSAPLNNLTLTLTSSGSGTISLMVF